METITLKFGEHIGQGLEHDVFKALGDKDAVYKIATWFGGKWQSQTRGFINRCLGSLEKRKIPALPIKIHEDVLCEKDNECTIEDVVIERGCFLEDMKRMRIKIKDFLNPETGPEMIKEGMKIIRDADAIYKEDKLGYDPHGGKVMNDIVKGFPQGILLKISGFMPEIIQKFINSQIKGVEGQMRNVLHRDMVEAKIGYKLKGEGKIVCTDPGMHNFLTDGTYRPFIKFFQHAALDIMGIHPKTDEGKYLLVTKQIHHVGMSGLLEVLRYANSKMPQEKQIPEQEFEDLAKNHFNGTKTHLMIAKLLCQIMMPVYEHYDEMHPYVP